MTTITITFTATWVILTIAIPLLFRKRGVQEGQMLATGFGILGTFIGIVAALINFDTGNIQAAVPDLLGGLQFAFITSVTGMGYSLLIGMIPKQLGFVSDFAGDDASKSEAELLAELLQETRQLNSSISGENDSTLITQIQKFRTNVTDKQDELKKSFDQFSEGMVNSNIDALAEAIEKVMGEFNTTVNDKLGKAFDDFKQAVENLNIWQSEYKEQISSQTENMKSVKISLDTTVDSIENVKKSFEEIVVIKQKFDELLQNLNAQLEGSLDFATSMKDLTQDLEGSGKVIKEEMKEITYGAANEMEKTMNKTLADFGSSLADISGKLAEDFEKVQKSLETSN